MHVLVIGSGFGGSIAARRFTEAGHTVELLELGEDWRGVRDVPQTADPAFLFRLLRNYPADFQRVKPRVLVTLGMGLGGGSLVYSAIHLRAPAPAFDGWPAGWTRAALDPYYQRVEDRLGVAPLPGVAEFPRAQVFAAAAARAGLPPPTPNPLALRGCTACGWCVPLCGFGRKQTMAHTYLADAERTGRLIVRTRRKAAFIARQGDRFRVACWSTAHVDRDYHRVNRGPLEHFEGDRVVVACGAIESPALLERSLRADLPRGWQPLRAFPTERLGRRLDGTGDFVEGGFVPQRVDGYKGSVMMMNVDLGHYVLEDIHGIPVGSTVMLDTRPAGIDRSWGLAYKERFRDYGRHLLAIAVIGKQGKGGPGAIAVHDDDGNAVVSGRPYDPPDGALAAARAMITSLGGELAESPYQLDGSVFTVHPVGGCRMGEVVSADRLELYENPGLYVIDGSALGGSPLRNPSHTIAAVAERALDAILR